MWWQLYLRDWTRNVQKLTLLCIPDSGIHYKTLNWGRFVLILLKFPVKCFEALWLWGILSEIQSAPQSDSFAIKSLPKPLKCGEFDNMLQIGSFTPHSQLIFLSTTLSFYHFINPENLENYPLWSLYSVHTSKSSKRSMIFLTPHKTLFTRLETWQLQQLPKTSPMLPPIQIWRTEAPLKKHSTWKHIQKHTASKEAHWEPAFPFFPNNHSQTINVEESFRRRRTKLWKSSKTEQNMFPSNPALSLPHLWKTVGG